jgi:hypothetical protein
MPCHYMLFGLLFARNVCGPRVCIRPLHPPDGAFRIIKDRLCVKVGGQVVVRSGSAGEMADHLTYLTYTSPIILGL